MAHLVVGREPKTVAKLLEVDHAVAVLVRRLDQHLDLLRQECRLPLPARTARRTHGGWVKEKGG